MSSEMHESKKTPIKFLKYITERKDEDMKQLNKTEYLCKRYRLYEFLTAEGFTCKQILTDATNKNYVNWLYDITPEFKEAIDWYFEKINAKDYDSIHERMGKR